MSVLDEWKFRWEHMTQKRRTQTMIRKAQEQLKNVKPTQRVKRAKNAIQETSKSQTAKFTKAKPVSRGGPAQEAKGKKA